MRIQFKSADGEPGFIYMSKETESAPPVGSFVRLIRTHANVVQSDNTHQVLQVFYVFRDDKSWVDVVVGPKMYFDYGEVKSE